jgi:hypothetical protein
MCKDGGNKKIKDDVRKACQMNGQLALMILVAHSRCYDAILERENIRVNNAPLWSVIEFSDAPNEVECTRHLAERGVTPDELADARQYAIGWLKDTEALEKTDTQQHIMINRALDFPAGPDNTTWPDDMSYHYDSRLARWMPVLPSVGTTVSGSQSVHGFGNAMDSPSQTQAGTPSLLPPIQEAVPSATVVVDNLPIPPDDNVEMEEAVEPPNVMEEDDPATLSVPPGTL